eukprot:2080675-Prymnesium_polylepis.1
MQNRFDATLTAFALLAWLTSRIVALRLAFAPWVEPGPLVGVSSAFERRFNDGGRALLALPIFRTLSAFDMTRPLCLGWGVIVSSYASVVGVLVAFLYSYAWLGAVWIGVDLGRASYGFGSMRQSLDTATQARAPGTRAEALEGERATTPPPRPLPPPSPRQLLPFGPPPNWQPRAPLRLGNAYKMPAAAAAAARA